MKIHPTAQVSSKADIGENVEIGPYSCISDNVVIGKDTVIAEHCIIKGLTFIGDRCKIFTGAVIGSIPQDLKYNNEKTTVEIGNDNIIREYVTINSGTSASGKTVLGNGNLLMAYAHIAHDSVIGNKVIIANVGTLAGHVIVEDNAIIGGLAAVHQFVKVGKLSIIGGCSKVVQDVPPYSIFDGCPAKVRGVNTVGLNRAGYSKQQKMEIKSAFKHLFKSGLSLKHAVETLNLELKTKEINYLIDFINRSERGIGR